MDRRSRNTMPCYREAPFVRYDGVRVHYEVTGDGGVPLVLLHGLGMTNYTWARNTEALARSRRVIAVEHMAMGDRTGLYRHGYSVANLAGAVVAVLDHLKIERADVCGVSLGGTLALFMGVQHPSRVRRLVAIDPAAYPCRWPWGLALAKVPLLGEIGTLLLPAWAFGRAIVMNCFRDPRTATSEFARQFGQVYRSFPGRIAVLKTTRALPPFGFDEIVEGYRHVDAPTLIIWGEHDPLIPRLVVTRLASDLPNARLEIIRDAAHGPHMEFPQIINPMIHDWLS